MPSDKREILKENCIVGEILFIFLNSDIIAVDCSFVCIYFDAIFSKTCARIDVIFAIYKCFIASAVIPKPPKRI